ncbi:DNA-3-methyladenine glycosylase family protein [Bacillus massiliglaciei]|uniref:DNA-3-methyladenine glycosylase family protein n=1 Tax=Bacillus massiliglaciei TaxID=1816693 RepID=UPI000AD61E75|nr:DNA-3-methyladenine glycosylase [Bacillus massiliglaciei]
MWTETVSIQGPYNFDLVLERLSMDPLQAVNFQEKTVLVPLMIGNQRTVLHVQAAGSTAEPVFHVTALTEGEKGPSLDKLKKIFHWHMPLADISEHFSRTDLQPVFEEHHGTPIVLDFDYFSCLAKCIIHQQLNLSFAHTLTERFVKTYGTNVKGAWYYPAPERTAALTAEELKALQFSGRKAEYVIGLSKEILSGNLDLEGLSHKSDQEIMDRLVKIRGIGRWTAENFLLFGLGRPNLFPKADIGIQNALKQLYRLPQKPTEEEMETYSKAWSPFLSYASLYLWRSIEKRSEKK